MRINAAANTRVFTRPGVIHGTESVKDQLMGCEGSGVVLSIIT